MARKHVRKARQDVRKEDFSPNVRIEGSQRKNLYGLELQKVSFTFEMFDSIWLDIIPKLHYIRCAVPFKFYAKISDNSQKPNSCSQNIFKLNI